MDRDESKRLLEMAASVWPAMSLAEHTATAWAMVLDDVPYADAAEALRTIARGQHMPPAVADVMREVRKTWDRREQEGRPNEVVPNTDPRNAKAYALEVGAIRKAIRRGTFDAQRYAEGGWTLAGGRPLPRREVAPGGKDRVRALVGKSA